MSPRTTFRKRPSLSIVIAGRGKVGTGLARGLRAADVKVRLVSGRKLGPRQVKGAELVVLAVPDDAIASCAHRIAPHLEPGTAVLHCAGARDVDALDAIGAEGFAVGVMHPMVSFADAKRPPSLRGTSLVVQGDKAAVRGARRIGKALGARVVVARVHGPAYHAAAALVANGAAALAHRGTRLLVTLGMRRGDALATVAGLLRTVAENVERIGVPNALTGPIARGDARTVRAHRTALVRTDAGALRAYDAVAPLVLDAAIDRGLSAGRAQSVRRAMKGDVRRSRTRTEM